MTGDNLQSSPGYICKLFMSRRPHAVLIAASALEPSLLFRRLQKRGRKCEGQQTWKSFLSTTLHDNNKRCFHQRTNVLDVPHGVVDCQGLGNLLSCFWTEFVAPKAAETGEKMRRLANMKSLLSYALHDNNKTTVLQGMMGRAKVVLDVGWHKTIVCSTHFTFVSLFFWISSRTPNVTTNSALVPEHSSLRPSVKVRLHVPEPVLLPRRLQKGGEKEGENAKVSKMKIIFVNCLACQ